MSLQRIGPGSVIAGRYQVEAQIGQGGMAAVYRAEDIQLGRKVAVKVLHAQYAEDQEFVERFRREAKAAAQLQHPGIVAIYDTGSWDGTWYIAMELLEGLTLKEKLVAEGRFPPSEAVDLTEQILRAVRAAHRDGIIHRDLKPHNVILDDEGRPKVTDFGIARRGASDMTATGSILGTAHYLAPEQAQGEVITPRTDLYAVGVCLYEMLTGRTPFEGESAVSIALAHVNNEPRSPRSLVPEIPPALDAVVLRALSKRPSDRFADADAFLAALADAKRGIAPVYAPPTGEHAAFVERRQPTDNVPVLKGPTPWYQRPWAIALFALLAVGAVVGALVLGTTKQVTVPTVVSASVGTASDRLEQEGFQVQITRRQSNDQPEDTVIAQIPTGGSSADQGSTVKLTVSSGASTATVPQVDGKSLEDARDQVETAGFTTSTRRQSSEDVAAGKIIETSPSGGSLARLDATVVLVVSSGRKLVVIPDLVGQPQEVARNQLGELGLLTKLVQKESADKEVGTVLSTDPTAGDKARVGDTVSLTVAAEPKPVPVPDVVGATKAAATTALEAAGFKVKTVNEDVDRSADNGRVVSSDPAGGQSGAKGSTVTIVIGVYTAPPTTPVDPSTP